MSKYEQVEWEKAECRDFDTELFYRIEEERNQTAYQYINAVRSICGRCPIQKACLEYAFGNEEFGVWGGLTGLERRSVNEPDRYPIQLKRALEALRTFGITFKEVKESYEHSIDGGSLENRFANGGKDGAARNRRPRLR